MLADLIEEDDQSLDVRWGMREAQPTIRSKKLLAAMGQRESRGLAFHQIAGAAELFSKALERCSHRGTGCPTQGAVPLAASTAPSPLSPPKEGAILDDIRRSRGIEKSEESLDHLAVRVAASPASPGLEQANLATVALGALAGTFDFAGQERVQQLARDAFDSRAAVLGSRMTVEQDALLALHLLLQYCDCAKHHVKHISKDFDAVWPHRVNSCMRDLLDSARDGHPLVAGLNISEPMLVEFCSRALLARTAKRYVNLRAHTCYLLGRVVQEQSKSKSRRLLADELKRLRAIRESEFLGVNGRSLRHLRRTVMISLAVLGDRQAATDYVLTLLRSAEDDDLNRGFHLEYYGDQAFDVGEPMSSHDALGPCERTFNRLEHRLLHLLKGNRSIEHVREVAPLAEIELHTFASLTQVRIGTAHQPNLQRATSLLRDAELKFSFSDSRMREYIILTIDKCAHGVSKMTEIALRFWCTKNVPRTGWIKRGVEHVESTGAHTFGAMLLALLFLPAGDESFSKDRVMRMLLVHDAAEGITGDIPTLDKKDDHRETENTLMRRFSLLGAFIAPPSDSSKIDLAEFYELYEEFERGSSRDARIAKCLDLADLILQAKWLLQSDAVFDRQEVQKLMEGTLRKLREMQEPEIFATIQTAMGQSIFHSSQLDLVQGSVLHRYMCGRSQPAPAPGSPD